MGTREGAVKYVNSLQNEWVEQLEKLSEIAKSEPQAAYAAFTAGFKHKVTYFIRTIPNLKDVLKPLDDVIDQKFIPALTEGHVLSGEERNLLSLPVRLGGLGIPVYRDTCEQEFENSQKMTQTLRQNILSQESVYVQDRRAEQSIELEIKNSRKQRQQNILTVLRSKMTKEQLRGNDLAQMKGASAWLTSLPLKDEGYVLNKREFFDSIYLRYRWDLKRLPTKCVCSQSFTMDHALQCQTGGYVIKRHNRIRDMLANFLDDVAHGVHTEPVLQPLTGERLAEGSNCKEDARVDVAARGFWQDCEMAFFDVKVFNPFAKSHLAYSLEAAFRSCEKMKKRAYNDRIIRVEHGTFTPVVLSAFGGFGVESSAFISKLVEKLCVKRGDEPSVVANYVRTKISFELIRSQVACIRGARRMTKMTVDTADMNLVTNSANIVE